MGNKGTKWNSLDLLQMAPCHLQIRPRPKEKKKSGHLGNQPWGLGVIVQIAML